jgi:thiol-disulfide isomerase/thioredoxin
LQGNAHGRYLKYFLSIGQIPSVGDHFADIGGLAPDGKAHKLSDLHGKYVLLEFWSSGCGPCRMENPELVKLYRAYQPKGFEIYGFSLDKNQVNWQKAIEKDGLPWTNVTDLAGQASPEASRYGVQALPQSFLIGPQGTIIAVNLRGGDLENKLAELLGKP